MLYRTELGLLLLTACLSYFHDTTAQPEDSSDPCDDLNDDVLNAIIAENFCQDAQGNINLLDEDKVCQLPELPDESEDVLSRYSKACPKGEKDLPSKRCPKKRPHTPDPGSRRIVCKDKGKLRIHETDTGESCRLRDTAASAAVGTYLAFPGCSSVARQGSFFVTSNKTSVDQCTAQHKKEIRESAKRADWRFCVQDSIVYSSDEDYSLEDICRLPSDKFLNTDIPPCTTDEDAHLITQSKAVARCSQNPKTERKYLERYKANLCQYSHYLFLWNIPNFGKLCTMHLQPANLESLTRCGQDAVTFLQDILSLARERIDPSRVPDCSPTLQTALWVTCYHRGVFYYWRQKDSNICRRWEGEKVLKWEYCSKDVVDTVKNMLDPRITTTEKFLSPTSLDVSAFADCNPRTFVKAPGSQKCVHQNVVFLWVEEDEFLCKWNSHKSSVRWGCSQNAVDFINRISALARGNLDTNNIPLCPKAAHINGAPYVTCFYRGVYFLWSQIKQHVCRRLSTGPRLVHSAKYCLEDAVGMMKRMVTTGSGQQGSKSKPSLQKYQVNVKLRRTSDAEEPSAKRFKRSMVKMVNASCPVRGFVTMQSFRMEPLNDTLKQPRTSLKTVDSEQSLDDSGSVLSMVQPRQNKKTSASTTGYQLKFNVLVRDDVAEKAGFNERILLGNLKQNADQFDDESYVIDANSITVRRVEPSSTSIAAVPVAWVVTTVAAAFALLTITTIIIIFISRRRRKVRKNLGVLRLSRWL